VDPKISALLALVKSPINAAKTEVKAATIPNRFPIGLTKYKVIIAPSRRIAETMTLKIATIHAMRSAGK
jgi:Flp pilus assembly protein protease CpaA